MSKLNKINNNLIMVEMGSDELPFLLSNDYKVVKTLSQITTDGTDTLVMSKCNASYFINNSSSSEYGQILGRNQGIKSDLSRINQKPNQNGDLYNYVITEDLNSHIGLFNSWDYTANNPVGLGVAIVLINDGNDVNNPSTSLGLDSSSINRVYSYSFFGQLTNGNYVMGACNNYSPNTARAEFKKKYSFKNLVSLDGGGSTQVNVDGRIVFNPDGSERRIPNALCFIKGMNPPVPPTPTDKIEYAIWHTEEMNITQGEGGSYSHYPNVPAIDNAQGTGESPAYAPFTMKVIGGINTYDRGYQVYYGSCDESGNPAKVRCADGTDRILTVCYIHSYDSKWGTMGTIYKTGEQCYSQGSSGQSTGPHIHSEVAEGWQTERVETGGPSYVLKNAISHLKVFHRLQGFTKVINDNGYDFKEVSSRSTDEPEPPVPPTPDPECAKLVKELREEIKRLNNVNDELTLENVRLNYDITELIRKIESLTADLEVETKSLLQIKAIVDIAVE